MSSAPIRLARSICSSSRILDDLVTDILCRVAVDFMLLAPGQTAPRAMAAFRGGRSRGPRLAGRPRLLSGAPNSWRLCGGAVQGRPVCELLDAAVEGAALDEFEVEVGRDLQDRVQAGTAGDDREECQLDAVDQAGRQ